MKSSDVETVLREYGSHIKSYTGDKISGSCPFAQWTHSGGSDKNPSFAAFRVSGGWRYKCMACGESGSMRTMFWRQYHFSKKYNLRVNQIVYAEQKEQPTRKSLDYRVGGSTAGKALHHKRSYKPFSSDTSGWTPIHMGSAEQTHMLGVQPAKKRKEYPVPVSAINRHQQSPIPEYVHDRGMVEVHKAWGFGNDEGNRRWVMPVFDPDGTMVGYTSRLYWDKGHCFRCGTDIRREDNPNKNMNKCPRCKQSYAKYKNHPGEWRRNAVFGAHMCKDGRPIVIVEGPTDVINLWRHGVRDAVAIFGASPSWGQVQLIASMTKDVIVMGDGDHAGQLMNQEVSAMFMRQGIKVHIVALDSGDPGEMSLSDIQSVLPPRVFEWHGAEDADSTTSTQTTTQSENGQAYACGTSGA